MKRPRTDTTKTTGRANERKNTGFGKIETKCGLKKKKKSSLRRRRTEDQVRQLIRKEAEQRGRAVAQRGSRLRESWLI